MKPLEASLGDENYKRLYGEVVEKDCYRVRFVKDIVSCNDSNFVHEAGHEGIKFVPDTVLDLGANVGIFTRYAAELWPDAKIISVEPNPDNFLYLEENKPANATIINKAIGKGDSFFYPGVNGAHHVYISPNAGYDLKDLTGARVESLMITDLKKYIKGKVVCKIDIEGNETVLFEDEESMNMLRSFDYVAFELHYHAMKAHSVPKVRQITDEALESFRATHNVLKDHVYFYATKK